MQLFYGCNPESKHDYKTLDSKRFDSQFPLGFYLDMADTSSLYDIYISSRINRALIEDNHLDLNITLISPSGDSAISKLSLPIASEPLSVNWRKVVSVKKRGKIYDIEWLYLHNTSISEVGRWRIEIDIDNKESFREALIGFGIKYEQQR